MHSYLTKNVHFYIDIYRKDTGRGYIYMLLKRKGYRKVMPRSKHPKKAKEEAIEASKKLTQRQKI